MIHMGTQKIETERLVLRRFKEDANAMFKNWVNDSEVTKFLTWQPHRNIEVTKFILNSWLEEYKKDNFYQWAITLKENGDEPIGTISIVEQNEEIDMVHIGYCMGQAFWRKGIMSEALSSVIEFAIEELRANRVESMHDPRNPNSGKVMMKCGLKYEGTLRQADKSNQGICDTAMYGILASEYYKN
ncbi:MAG: GNAT family N-acetyltransferase [Sarcina sp.]